MEPLFPSRATNMPMVAINDMKYESTNSASDIASVGDFKFKYWQYVLRPSVYGTAAGKQANAMRILAVTRVHFVAQPIVLTGVFAWC